MKIRQFCAREGHEISWRRKSHGRVELTRCVEGCLAIAQASPGTLKWAFRSPHLAMRLRQIARQLDVRFEERLAERSRIARELHDTLLQSFQGALLRFRAVTYMEWVGSSAGFYE